MKQEAPNNQQRQSLTVRRALAALNEDTDLAKYRDAVAGWRAKQPYRPRETPIRETKAGAWLIE